MFDWNDAQQAEAFALWGFLVVFMGLIVAGWVMHSLNREWRQYLKYRQFCAARKAMYESDGK